MRGFLQEIYFAFVLMFGLHFSQTDMILMVHELQLWIFPLPSNILHFLPICYRSTVRLKCRAWVFAFATLL